MVISAILEGLCGLLLLPIIVYWHEGVSQYLWMLAGLTLVTLLFQYIATLKGFLSGTSVMKILVQALIKHLPRSLAPPVQAETLCSGAAMSAMSIPAHLLAPIISTVITSLTVIIGLFFYDMTTAMVFIAAALSLITVIRISAKGLYKQEGRLQKADSVAAKTLSDFAQYQALLRKSGRNSQFSQQLQQDFQIQHTEHVDLLQRSLPYHIAFSLCIQTIFIIVLVGGVWSINSNGLSLTGWLAIVVLIARFIEPLYQLSHIDQALRQSKQALKQIEDVLKTHTLISPKQSESPSSREIRCQALSFYNSAGKAILSNVSLQCPDKKMTAIVGASGAGKTTLLRLLSRLIDTDNGKIYYGDKAVTALSESVLAKTRQVVFQNNSLLKGSLRWSLLQNEVATMPDNDILQLLSMLNLTLTVSDLDNDVGNQGDRFSGGQKQRLCLARSLLAKPEILFLDEPTANLDAVSAEKTADYLQQLNCTRVVITHNPELAKRADYIIVLDKGEVVEQGTLTELLSSSVWFAQFCH